MATRTPQREESMAAAGSSVDKEWVTEHARQVGKEGRGSIPIHTQWYSSMSKKLIWIITQCVEGWKNAAVK